MILDSSILVAKERGRFALDAFLAAHPHESFFLSAVTVSELWHGVERATPSARKVKREQLVREWLADFAVMEFDAQVARLHARIWAELEIRGTVIGSHDLLIAATALHYNQDIATLNAREFSRVDGLHLAEVAPFVLPKTSE